jgi:hypothetical protein
VDIVAAVQRADMMRAAVHGSWVGANANTRGKSEARETGKIKALPMVSKYFQKRY